MSRKAVCAARLAGTPPTSRRRTLAVSCLAITGPMLIGFAAPSVALVPAASDTRSASAATAAAFLARQLAEGNGMLNYPGTDQADIGVTVDAILGVVATRSGHTQALASTDAVEAVVNEYLGPAFAATELYAGPVAKTALLAEVTGRDPQAFGGRDLLADLTALETTEGRYADRTAYTQTSNSFTQALGLIALHRAGREPSTNAVAFLLAQQCSDGGFRIFLEKPGCESDPDAAALAVLALSATGGQDAARDRALDYLADRQEESGALEGGTGSSGINSNTTGLAGMAFRVAGREAEHTAANDFLATLQLGCDAPVAVRGAIAYDPAGYRALIAAGASALASDQERRATAQAMLSSAVDSLLDASIEHAGEPADTCAGGPTSSPSSTTSSPSPTESPTPSPTSSTPPPAPSPSTPPHPTVTSTTTVTIPGPRSVAPPVTVTTTRTLHPAPSPANEPAADPSASPSTQPSSTTSAGSTAQASTPAPTSTTGPSPALAAPAAATGPVAGGAVRAPAENNPWALAGGGAFILLGGAAATYILRRPRSTR